MRRHSHHRHPPRPVICFRDPEKCGGSHKGLGVSAVSIVHCLRDHGIPAEAWGVKNGEEMEGMLNQRPEVTHLNIMARWIDTPWMRGFVNRHPHVRIAVTCHSHVGFLQASPWDIKTLGEQLFLQREAPNFTMSGNSTKYCNWVQRAYNQPCRWIPNLYWIGHDKPLPGKVWKGGTLRVGVFGATRLLKNMGSSAGAILVMASDLQCPAEMWVSCGRNEGSASVMESVRHMLRPAQNVKLVEMGWQAWPEFLETVRMMDICLQPSFTESFNNTVADAINVGVASVVSPAITWVPESWKVDPDNPILMAERGKWLLGNRNAARDGFHALKEHNRKALQAWLDFLTT